MIPEIIQGGISVDDRGQLTFVNPFQFEGVKRFYMVENFSTEIVRAFHGHMQETKYIFVISGSAIVFVAKREQLPIPERFILSGRNPQVLKVPAGYFNGFRCLESGTRIMFFSTATLEESEEDDLRIPWDYFNAGIWGVKNR